MSLLEHHARYRRQIQENAAWRLLRAANAPMVLAFITDLFDDSNDVLFSRAKAALEGRRSKEDGLVRKEIEQALEMN